MIGIRKAPVLPVPVLAIPMIFSPSKIISIVLSCISVVLTNFLTFKRDCNLAWSGKEAKERVTTSFFSVCVRVLLMSVMGSSCCFLKRLPPPLRPPELRPPPPFRLGRERRERLLLESSLFSVRLPRKLLGLFSCDLPFVFGFLIGCYYKSQWLCLGIQKIEFSQSRSCKLNGCCIALIVRLFFSALGKSTTSLRADLIHKKNPIFSKHS